ncbi:MAG: hypothetical protein K0R71_184 [Bacillales bacterium]|jgi:uncharacterized protein YaiI (UPF0178 family)|nr:hypothetical protein [Bacillales bacterium]
MKESVYRSKVYVDADACPVKEEILELCREFENEVYFVASFRNMTDKYPQIQWIWVEPGRDSADISIMNHVKGLDIVITDDIGLSAGCLGKGARVINSRGGIIDNNNIDILLATRHISAVERRSGNRTKGPKKLQKEDKIKFSMNLKKFLSKNAGV